LCSPYETVHYVESNENRPLFAALGQGIARIPLFFRSPQGEGVGAPTGRNARITPGEGPGLLRTMGVQRHARRLARRQAGILAFVPFTVVGPGRLLVAGEAARVRPGDEVASSIARRCRSRSPPSRRLMNAPLVEWIGMGGRIIKPKVKSSIIFTVGVLLDGERKPLGRRPAQAGTHNPHTMLFSSAVPQRCAAAYGSPPARGRQQRVKACHLA